MKNTDKFSGQKSGEWIISRKMMRQSNRTRQKTKREDRKVESNDSCEIPESRETSDTPGLP